MEGAKCWDLYDGDIVTVQMGYDFEEFSVLNINLLNYMDGGNILCYFSLGILGLFISVWG